MGQKSFGSQIGDMRYAIEDLKKEIQIEYLRSNQPGGGQVSPIAYHYSKLFNYI